MRSRAGGRTCPVVDDLALPPRAPIAAGAPKVAETGLDMWRHGAERLAPQAGRARTVGLLRRHLGRSALRVGGLATAQIGDEVTCPAGQVAADLRNEAFGRPLRSRRAQCPTGRHVRFGRRPGPAGRAARRAPMPVSARSIRRPRPAMSEGPEQLRFGCLFLRETAAVRGRPASTEVTARRILPRPPRPRISPDAAGCPRGRADAVGMAGRVGRGGSRSAPGTWARSRRGQTFARRPGPGRAEGSDVRGSGCGVSDLPPWRRAALRAMQACKA